MRMRLWGIGTAIMAVAACSSGGTPTEVIKKAQAVDPYISILVTDSLDTTTAPGRAHWHVDLRVVDTVHGSGMAAQPGFDMADMRLDHRHFCTFAGADSVGARLIDVVAVGDTMTDQTTADSTASRMLNAWGQGDTTLDAGWMPLHTGLVNPWDSQQFKAGHGLTTADPIRWYLTWTGRGTVRLVERAPTDTTKWPCA